MFSVEDKESYFISCIVCLGRRARLQILEVKIELLPKRVQACVHILLGPILTPLNEVSYCSPY